MLFLEGKELYHIILDDKMMLYNFRNAPKCNSHAKYEERARQLGLRIFIRDEY